MYMEQYTCGKDTNVTSVTVLEHRTGILCSTSTYELVTRLFTLSLRFVILYSDAAGESKLYSFSQV